MSNVRSELIQIIDANLQPSAFLASAKEDSSGNLFNMLASVYEEKGKLDYACSYYESAAFRHNIAALDNLHRLVAEGNNRVNVRLFKIYSQGFGYQPSTFKKESDNLEYAMEFLYTCGGDVALQDLEYIANAKPNSKNANNKCRALFIMGMLYEEGRHEKEKGSPDIRQAVNSYYLAAREGHQNSLKKLLTFSLTCRKEDRHLKMLIGELYLNGPIANTNRAIDIFYQLALGNKNDRPHEYSITSLNHLAAENNAIAKDRLNHLEKRVELQNKSSATMKR